MTAKTYEFRPMSAGDLSVVQRWLAMPHVVQWWGQPDEQLALVRDDLDQPAMDQYIVVAADTPFGYLQCYPVAAWDTGFGPQPDGARGIDLFIGVLDMIGRRHGSALIRAFTDDLIESGTPRVVTDPDPANAQAIGAYEKAGFKKDRLVDTPDGLSLLMVRNA